MAFPSTPPARHSWTASPSADVEPGPASRSTTGGRVQLYGPLGLTLFLLATSKWGSYLPIGKPPYIADIVLAAVIVGRVAQATKLRTRASSTRCVEPLVWGSATALLVWSGITLALGPLTQNALRDAAPYVYVIVVFIVQPLPQRAQPQISRAITATLVLHATWVTLVEIDPSIASRMPALGGIHIFYLRTDFDSVACGLLATLSLHKALTNRRPHVNLLLTAWGTALVLALISRAGLLAFAMQLVVVLSLAPARRAAGGRDNRLVVALIAACLPAVVISLSHSSSVQRLSTVAGASTASNQTEIRAAGSAHARSESWRVLIHYIEARPQRNLVGVGFGPDFLHDSGADLPLLGGINQDVRSPHNYLLNTWARLGIVGLALVVALILSGFRLALVTRRHVTRLTDHDTLALLLVASIPIAALLGVILESPFGAIPYFWAVGHLSARVTELGILRPFSIGPPVRPAQSSVT